MPEHVIPSLIQRIRDEKKTCLDCPMLLQAGDGSSMCKAKNIPLKFRTWDVKTAELAYEQQASSCEFYGIKFPPETRPWDEYHRPNVIWPVSRATTRPTIPRLSESGFSCVKCKHFIPENLMRGSVALTPANFIGLCGSKGVAIPSGQQTIAAGDCLNYELGDFPVEGIYSIKLGPTYSPEYLAKRAGARINHLPAGFDPTIFTSELEVTPEQKAMGIRAWVGIKDPKSTNKVYLPIYERAYIYKQDFLRQPEGTNVEKFQSQEVLKIPNTGDDTMPGSYIDHSGLVYKVAVAWVELDETPALIGEAGNGKTELLRHIAWIMQLPFERITITATSEVDDLAGKFLFEDGETVFHKGRLSRAWAKPNVVCLDEPNTGPNEVLQFIRPLIDNSKQLVIDQDKGQMIFRDAGCFLGMAMNPAYDYKNVGANTMADADNSRLLHLEVSLPPEIVEREIVKARLLAKDDWNIPDRLLDAVMSISRTLREMSKDGEVPFSWGLRVQIKVARLLKWFDFHDAYLIAMGSSVDDATQEQILAVVTANTPART